MFLMKEAKIRIAVMVLRLAVEGKCGVLELFSVGVLFQVSSRVEEAMSFGISPRADV